jgi:hypothetical protein
MIGSFRVIEEFQDFFLSSIIQAYLRPLVINNRWVDKIDLGRVNDEALI